MTVKELSGVVRRVEGVLLVKLCRRLRGTWAVTGLVART